jgi:thioredoxin 1
MGRIRGVLTLVALLLAAVGQAVAGDAAAPLSTPELKQAIGSGKNNTVVFFINPMGGPCKAQKQVLEQLHKDRGGKFNIAYVSTMRAEDQRAFYDYGVRSLPTVVLVDKRGKIARYFPPGIQSYETLAAALDGIK